MKVKILMKMKVDKSESVNQASSTNWQLLPSHRPSLQVDSKSSPSNIIFIKFIKFKQQEQHQYHHNPNFVHFPANPHKAPLPLKISISACHRWNYQTGATGEMRNMSNVKTATGEMWAIVKLATCEMRNLKMWKVEQLSSWSMSHIQNTIIMYLIFLFLAVATAINVTELELWIIYTHNHNLLLQATIIPLVTGAGQAQEFSCSKVFLFLTFLLLEIHKYTFYRDT